MIDNKWVNEDVQAIVARWLIALVVCVAGFAFPYDWCMEHLVPIILASAVTGGTYLFFWRQCVRAIDGCNKTWEDTVWQTATAKKKNLVLIKDRSDLLKLLYKLPAGMGLILALLAPAAPQVMAGFAWMFLVCFVWMIEETLKHQKFLLKLADKEKDDDSDGDSVCDAEFIFYKIG